MASIIRWLQIKKYQYEVTFSLYMLTSTEKFVFNIILLTLMSLLITAAAFYLPNHIQVVSSRIWYYIHGEFHESMVNNGFSGGGTGAKSLMQATTTVAQAVVGTATATAEQVLRAKNEL